MVQPPIPAELVSKITSSQFVDLADPANLRTAEQELQKKCHDQVVEIQDILTWTEAFTIFQLVMCATHAHRWLDLAKYKFLIIQTALQSHGRAWLKYYSTAQK